MKLTALIIDDEPIARNFLERYCEKTGTIDVVGSFSDSESAYSYLQQNEVDILFLDVEMPGDSGFQLLDRLIVMPKVILTTSKTDYAYDAFQYKVTDYLKKPFTYIRFQEAVGKVNESFEDKKETPKQEDIFIKSNGKLIRLNYDDILYIESLGDYVKYCTFDKKYVTHSTLKAVEEKMNKGCFMKVHRSYIVNLRKINNIEDYTLYIGDSVIPISKMLKTEVMGRINVAS
ncbi:MAG: DNA-binding response regulator [Ferruginibacter sp.]|uniref:LytR/AlgR family response regulator transcription factor n=1 Tax=Ferruginibacter sp. TaxID=1940288 RepID=UPI00265B1906|nr:LytTR family DNA-binding domain-containing protein [Ferruginibacter sp.]MDB5278688.1 DNA-binding response regulator [Ferruginibacter sp.]